MGYSSQQYYEIRHTFQVYEAAGLLDKFPGATGLRPEQVSEEVEQKIFDYSLYNPTHGCLKVSPHLNLIL